MCVLTFSPGPLRMPLARTTVFSRYKEINQTLIHSTCLEDWGVYNYSNVTQRNKLLIDIDPQDFPRKSIATYYRLHAARDPCTLIFLHAHPPDVHTEGPSTVCLNPFTTKKTSKS